MPFYEYACDKCNHTTEIMAPVNKKPASVKCEKCGKKAKSIISSGHFEVKGANAANRYSGDSNFKWYGGDE